MKFLIALLIFSSLSVFADCSLTLVDQSYRSNLQTDEVVRVLEEKGYSVEISDSIPASGKYIALKIDNIHYIYAPDANIVAVILEELKSIKGIASITYNIDGKTEEQLQKSRLGMSDERALKIFVKSIKRNISTCM